MSSEEHIILVNKQDRIVGYRPRSQVRDDDVFRFALVWIEDGKGNALIHRRADHKRFYPGRWQNAAGGFVSRGETYRQAALRELQEELGIQNVRLKQFAKTFVESDGSGRWAAWFLLILDAPLETFHTKPDEVAELRWIDRAELFAWREKNPELFMPSSAHWREVL